MSKIIATIKKEPALFLFAKLWRFSKGNRGNVVFFLCLFIISNLVALLGPLIFGEFLNEIQRNGVAESNLPRLLFILSLFVGTTLLFWLFHGVGRVVERMNAFRARVAYREYLLQGVLDLGLPWHGARDSGDTIDKVDKASEGLYHFSDRTFLVMEIIIRIIGTAGILYFFNPIIGIAVVPFILVTFFTLFQFDRRLVKHYKNLNFLENRIAAKIFDALSNVTSVIILSVARPIMKNIRRVMLIPQQLYRKNVLLNEIKWFTGSLLFSLLAVLPLAFFIVYSLKQGIAVEVGTISALYLYLGNLSEIFFTFGDFYEKIIVDKTSVQNAADIEEAFATDTVRRKAVPGWKMLEFRDISFTYEDSEHHTKHLKDISLTVQRGERIALIGESGSGKTTFLKVLHGLYPSAEGVIAFDNQTIWRTNFTDIDLHTMLVPQEPELFSASIRENVTFGVDYPKEDIQDVLDLAQFSDVLAELPRGLKSAINEKGVNLSGGQKQRLALARALLFARNKEIILLDESTSSVDPKNETKIYENIFSRFKGKTIIASIHKMNLLKYFDRIIIFEGGIVADSGTFDELLAHNSGFRRNWESHVQQST